MAKLPSPLKKIQEQLIPEGEICNLRITSAFLADNFEPHSLGIEAVVIDGEYEGEPVTDYLNIQESKKNPGELYISKKGKMHRTLKNSLTTREFNDLADRLAKVEMDRDNWIEIIAEALKNAENPVFRSVVVQNDPEDPADKRNKLTKEPEQIAPYLDPEEDAKLMQKLKGVHDGSKVKGEPKDNNSAKLSAKEEASMKEAFE
jgi:hypothetical protein